MRSSHFHSKYMPEHRESTNIAKHVPKCVCRRNLPLTHRPWPRHKPALLAWELLSVPARVEEEKARPLAADAIHFDGGAP